MAKKSQEKFNFLPISYDEDEDLVKLLGDYSDPLLTRELKALNRFHRRLDKAPFNTLPSPFVTLEINRISAIKNSCSLGIAALGQGRYLEAIALYTQAIEISRGRPEWENAKVLEDQLEQLYRNRAQAHMWVEHWPEGLADSEASITLKENDNVKAHVWKAYCLKKMGRFEEARDALLYASDISPLYAAEPAVAATLEELAKLMNERDES